MLPVSANAFEYSVEIYTVVAHRDGFTILDIEIFDEK